MAATASASQTFYRSSRRYGRASRVRTYHPASVMMLGLTTMLLGAWAAVAVFVGPEFGYRPTTESSWTWTAGNWILHLWPGVVAGLGGLVFILFADARSGVSRRAIRLAALAAMAAGIWLVIGPAVWPTFESTSPYATSGSANMVFLFQLGPSLGPGILVVALAAIVFVAIAGREPQMETAVDTETAADARTDVPTDTKQAAAPPHPTEPAESAAAAAASPGTEPGEKS